MNYLKEALECLKQANEEGETMPRLKIKASLLLWDRIHHDPELILPSGTLLDEIQAAMDLPEYLHWAADLLK
jgi:hypothetical protein